MLNLIKEEAKTNEEALKKILEKTNEKEESLVVSYEQIEGKLFKSSKCIAKAYLKSDIKLFLEEFVKTIGKYMNLNIECEIIENEEIYQITLVSNNNSILIGHDGKTLNSIQIILRQIVKNNMEIPTKVNVDVANYKVKKMKKIEFEVKKIAKEVLNSKIDASLDPMNSYERRLIHNMINEYPNLTTESVGEGKERHIIIKYIEKP